MWLAQRQLPAVEPFLARLRPASGASASSRSHEPQRLASGGTDRRSERYRVHALLGDVRKLRPVGLLNRAGIQQGSGDGADGR